MVGLASFKAMLIIIFLGFVDGDHICLTIDVCIDLKQSESYATLKRGN